MCGTVRSTPKCSSPLAPVLRSARRPCPTPCLDRPRRADGARTEVGIIGGGKCKAIAGDLFRRDPSAARGALKRSPRCARVAAELGQRQDSVFLEDEPDTHI